MKKSIEIFVRAVLAGVLIGIGGTVNLSVENRYIGAFLFSLGLFTIIRFDLCLYTGKVGYIPQNKPPYILDVLLILCGNVFGTAVTALLISFTRPGLAVRSRAAEIMNSKLSDNFTSVFILAVFCGMLMYIAVENARKSAEKAQDMSAVFGIVMPVMVFILSGFNHSVADCFYLFSADITAAGLLYIAIVAAGNALGGMLIPLALSPFIKHEI